jgi:hypothetical protein
MRALVLDAANLPPREELLDTIICENVKVGGQRLFKKGHRLGLDDLDRLERLEGPVHALHLGPEGIHEDEAGTRLARAIAGDGIEIRAPVLSRVNLVAARKGLLRVDAETLLAMNRLPGIGIFTLIDRLSVLPGKNVAGAKITPVAIERSVLEEAEAIASQATIVQVKPFLPLTVGVVTTEGLKGRVRDRFRDTVRGKVGWYGGSVHGFVDLPDHPENVAAAIKGFIDDGVDIVMTGGGNTIDPLDPTLLAVNELGGEIVKFGAAAHPGSMFWLAYCGDVPIVNLASCSMYSKSTVADLVLPWIMAGERVTLDDLAGLGYGGLLDRDMQYRFPPYDAEESDDGDEGD